MLVVASSVIILFALIFLGFFIGKRNIVQKSSIPDLSNLVLMVTMPVTVFLSIVDQQGADKHFSIGQIFIGAFVIHAVICLITLLLVRLFRIPEKEHGVWLFSLIFSNNGFMGLPLALSVFGSVGMFYMALANVISNLIMFSIGIKFLTMHYDIDQPVSIKKMFLNNINKAVVIGFVFLIFMIPVPDLVGNLLNYIGNITSGLSMLVVGLSLSRLNLKDVFVDKKMFLLAALRLVAIPLVVIGIFAILPFQVDPMVRNVLVLMSALPSASAQSMITEQYGTNTTAASRAVCITTLFSVVSVPLLMIIGLR